MARHLLMAFSNPLEGLEEEFNRWYNEVHLADVLKVPGYISAQRFELSPTQMMPDAPYRYVALYEVETDDLQMTSNTLQFMPQAQLPVSDSWDYERCATWWFTPITEPVAESPTSD